MHSSSICVIKESIDPFLEAYPKGSFSPLSYKNDGLAKYQIQNNREPSGYVVFTGSCKDGWLPNGINPIPNLGTTSAYPIDGSEKEFTVYLERINLLIIGYSISGITLIGIIIFYFKDRIVSTPM